RSQSFVERSNAQPLPLPGLRSAAVSRTASEISISTKPKLEKGSKSSLFLPLPRPACIRSRANPADLDGDLITASISSESSIDSDDQADSRHRSPLANDYDNGTRTAASSPSSVMPKDHLSNASQTSSREEKKPANLSLSNRLSPSPKQRRLSGHVPNLQVPYHGAFSSAPDSSLSSPSRSPLRAFGSEQVVNSAFWSGKPYADVTLLGSGHCSSPGSGQNSGNNSMGGDMSGQLFWQQLQSRGSPEYSPIPSPRMTSPGPSSRIQSGAVTPIHPRAGGAPIESQTSWPDDGKQQSHRLPLPPITISNSSPFSHSNSAATSPSVPRSPGRMENPVSPESHWKKGKMLGRGTFGHVYVGFNSDSGEMCAMKEVTLFDDAKSKESAKQLMQGQTLYITWSMYLVGQFINLLPGLWTFWRTGQFANIHNQIYCLGLAFLHSKHYSPQFEAGLYTDLAYLCSFYTLFVFLNKGIYFTGTCKGANILVDPNGRVKLADFWDGKCITSSGCNLAVDIWSLGGTVFEMATTKPPWQPKMIVYVVQLELSSLVLR
ncbi:hypothetical protein CUMW_284660, partial [Citrus unshiu]